MISPIAVSNSFLTNKECKFLIDYFEKHYEENGKYTHKGTQTLVLPYSSPFHLRKEYLRRKIRNNILSHYPNLIFNYDHIVKWPFGSSREYHYDRDPLQHGQLRADWTSVCYLNEDYEGGKTMLEKLNVKPRTGRISMFNSKNIRHGVERVHGTRYTYIAWWQEN